MKLPQTSTTVYSYILAVTILLMHACRVGAEVELQVNAVYGPRCQPPQQGDDDDITEDQYNYV